MHRPIAIIQCAQILQRKAMLEAQAMSLRDQDIDFEHKSPSIGQESNEEQKPYAM